MRVANAPHLKPSGGSLVPGAMGQTEMPSLTSRSAASCTGLVVSYSPMVINAPLPQLLHALLSAPGAEERAGELSGHPAILERPWSAAVEAGRGHPQQTWVAPAPLKRHAVTSARACASAGA